MDSGMLPLKLLRKKLLFIFKNNINVIIIIIYIYINYYIIPKLLFTIFPS